MSNFRESALIFGKAVLSVEPLTGVAIKVIEDFRAAAREKALADLLNAFQARLRDLEERLEPRFVTTEEFADLFKSCVSVADRTHREEKLRAAANALANVLLRESDPEKLPFSELDHFVRCLERLSLQSLDTLSMIATASLIYGSDEARTLSEPLWISFLIERLPQIDPDLIHAALDELHHARFANVDRTPYEPSETGLRFDPLSETGQSVYTMPASGPPSVTVTPLGWRFRKYVLRDVGPMPDATVPSSSPEPASS